MNIDTDKKRQLQAEKLKEQEKEEHKAREQARKNRNLVQFYRNNIVEFDYLIDLNPFSVKLLLFISEHMDNLNVPVCSYAIFEDNFGVTKNTIQ